MVDLETMGTKPYSVIMSIGCVAFDLATGELGSEFYATIDMESSKAAGLTTEQSTIDWWNKQDAGVKALMYKDTKPLNAVLREFSAWLKAQHGSYKYMWGNSASFDLGLLGQAYDKCNIAQPWAFFNERCVRTIVALNPKIKENSPKPYRAHSPVVDCKYQIDYVVRTIKSVTK